MLRKQYEHLTPFERAVATSVALETQREALVDALASPNPHDAFATVTHMASFATMAFTAVHFSQLAEGERRSAWLLALQTLDAETGCACMAAARVVASAYIDSVLQDMAALEGVEFAGELACLRQMWNAYAQYVADAPMATEAVDGMDWQ
jgi:hypothetical protein